MSSKSWEPASTAVVCVECQNGVLGPDSVLPALATDSAHLVGIVKVTVAKIWANHNPKPRKVETFTVSDDPDSAVPIPTSRTLMVKAVSTVKAIDKGIVGTSTTHATDHA